MSDSFDEYRRKIIKQSISASTLALVAASGLITPRVLLAHWPQDAFNAETLEDAILTFLGEAEEVAELVSFLASKKASYITGEVININGGLYS